MNVHRHILSIDAASLAAYDEMGGGPLMLELLMMAHGFNPFCDVVYAGEHGYVLARSGVQTLTV